MGSPEQWYKQDNACYEAGMQSVALLMSRGGNCIVQFWSMTFFIFDSLDSMTSFHSLADIMRYQVQLSGSMLNTHILPIAPLWPSASTC
jgi:hypothetical protein